MAPISPTAVVAWWGAILASIVFLWDIYKFRSAGRPKLRFDVRTGTVLSDNPKRVLALSEVTNYGDRTTTLTTIAVSYFENKWSWCRLRNRPTKAAVLIDPCPRQPFPYELQAGSLWRGLTDQTPELEAWARNGMLYFDLYHSHSTKPVRRRVRVQPRT